MSARVRDEDDEMSSSEWDEWEVVNVGTATEKIKSDAQIKREEAEEKAQVEDLHAQFEKQQRELEARQMDLERERIRYQELWKSYERQNKESSCTQSELKSLDADRRKLQEQTKEMAKQLEALAEAQRQMKQEHAMQLSSAMSAQQAQAFAQQQMLLNAMIAKTSAMSAANGNNLNNFNNSGHPPSSSSSSSSSAAGPNDKPNLSDKKGNRRKKGRKRKGKHPPHPSSSSSNEIPPPPPPPVMPVISLQDDDTVMDMDEFLFTWKCPVCQTENDESLSACRNCNAKNQVMHGLPAPMKPAMVPPPSQSSKPAPNSAAAMGGIGLFAGLANPFDFGFGTSATAKNPKVSAMEVSSNHPMDSKPSGKKGSGVDVVLTFQGALGGDEPFLPGKQADCGWILRNDSKVNLRLGVTLERVKGDPLLRVREEDTRLEYSVKTGEELFVFIHVTAPPIPGSFPSQWRLVRKNGMQVGPLMNLNLNVKRNLSAKKENKVKQLVGMGFSDRKALVAALQAAKWDVSEAAIQLMENGATD